MLMQMSATHYLDEKQTTRFPAISLSTRFASLSRSVNPCPMPSTCIVPGPKRRLHHVKPLAPHELRLNFLQIEPRPALQNGETVLRLGKHMELYQIRITPDHVRVKAS